MKQKTPSVEEFLRTKKADPTWRGGQRCLSCTHPKAQAINGELRVFAKAKKEGHAMPWKRFLRDRIGEVYGLKLAPTAIMRHVRDCLGIP